MTQTDSANTAQIEHWNTRAGQTWVKFQEALDRQVEPLGLAAMTTLQPKEGEHILDIGCGCGQTSVDLARLVGATGSVLGVDISQPMLEVAQRRPLPARNLHVIFEQLDAQSGDLGHERFDAVFSRFGVMFFSDPVAAFVNIRKALKPAGRLAFVCWRPLEQNPWMHAPLDAALPLLPPLPPPDPTAPGPFAPPPIWARGCGSSARRYASCRAPLSKRWRSSPITSRSAVPRSRPSVASPLRAVRSTC